MNTEEFNGENRLIGKLIFNYFQFSAWKRPFVTTLFINKRKVCLGLSLSVSGTKNSMHPDEETSFSCRLPCWWRVQRLQSFPKIVLGSKGQPKPELGQSSVAARSGIRVQVKNGRKGESFFQLVTLLIIKISVLIERMLCESVINSDLPLGNPGLPISAPYMEIISLQF